MCSKIVEYRPGHKCLHHLVEYNASSIVRFKIIIILHIKKSSIILRI